MGVDAADGGGAAHRRPHRVQGERTDNEFYVVAEVWDVKWYLDEDEVTILASLDADDDGDTPICIEAVKAERAANPDENEDDI